MAFVGVLINPLQHLAKIAQSLGTVLVVRSLQVVQEPAHGLQAGDVERLQNVERGEQERARAAGRIED